MDGAGKVARRWAWLALVAVGLVGCGGGAGTAGSTGVDPQAMSLEARTEATDRLAQRLEQITGGAQATPAQLEELRAWVVTQPEFVDAGTGNQLVWARFRDGRYFVYTDGNWGRLPPGSVIPPDPAPASSLLAQGALAKAGAAPDVVPGSPRAVLLTHSGAPTENEFADGIPLMRKMDAALKARGWKVDPQRALTIAALRNVGEVGFLYINSHSAKWGPKGKEEFSVMLDDEASTVSELSHLGDLNDGALMYHRDRTLWQTLGRGTPPRYAATAQFVSKYLQFAPGSLMIMLSCESGSDDAEGFRNALMAKGLGTLIGWKGNSNPNAYRPMGLLIDRMAGVNQFEPVTPGNRAFNFADVWQYLERNGLTVTPAVPGGFPATIERFGDGFSKLSPVVAALQARGDKVVVYGDLGTVPGTITVGGVPVAATWDPDGKRAVATLGNATHGEVIVKVGELTSNPRVLGDWRGTVTYRRESEEVTGCGGAKFHNTVIVDLHLRADMHGVRDEVDGQVKNNPYYLIPAPDTTATWTAGGECVTQGQTHTRWSGSGSFGFNTAIVFEEQPGPVQGNVLTARIDAVQRRFQLNGLFGQDERKTVFSLGSTSQEPLVFDTDLFGFDNDAGDENLLAFGTFLPFSAQLAVGAHRQVIADPVQPHSMDIRWTAWPVSPGYDDAIGR